MDLSPIPKFFWYCCGIAILVSTFGLVVVAYRSAEVSVEIAHTKIQLSGAIADVKSAISDVERKDEPRNITLPGPSTRQTVQTNIDSAKIERVKNTLDMAQQRIMTKE